MIVNQFTIKQKISKTELAEMKVWLETELEEAENDFGFFNNWNIIERAYLDNKLFIIKSETLVIGFLAWTKKEICAEIDIFEIKPTHRNQQIGKYFIEEICKYWTKTNLKVVRLFCRPRESEKFWKSLNFIKFPDIRYSISHLTYYKPLIKINEPSSQIDERNKVELWNVEPHKIIDVKPEWTWNVHAENFLPILNPCDPNWNIRYTKNGIIIKESKIKRFDNNKIVDYDSFLFIEKLAVS